MSSINVTQDGRSPRIGTAGGVGWLARQTTFGFSITTAIPPVSLYMGWSYLLVEAGPEQALTWRTGHMRGEGSLPDLFFPADHSWLVSALWDDTWTDIGASIELITALQRNPLVAATPVGPDADCLPAGLTRE